jgi:hypothetical protein
LQALRNSVGGAERARGEIGNLVQTLGQEAVAELWTLMTSDQPRIYGSINRLWSQRVPQSPKVGFRVVNDHEITLNFSAGGILYYGKLTRQGGVFSSDIYISNGPRDLTVNAADHLPIPKLACLKGLLATSVSDSQDLLAPGWSNVTLSLRENQPSSWNELGTALFGTNP